MVRIASYSTPLIVAGVGLLILLSKKDLLAEFLSGAKEGLNISINLLPTLIALIVSITMFRASGALDVITDWLSPVFAVFQIPKEIIAFMIMRPISGSGSTALLNDLFKTYGADSYAGKTASVIFASSDTVFYIFAVYFGAAAVKKTRYALPAALIAQFLCVIAACVVVRMFW